MRTKLLMVTFAAMMNRALNAGQSVVAANRAALLCCLTPASSFLQAILLILNC